MKLQRILFLFLCVASVCRAQVPHSIAFQAGVSVNGTNFSGIGWFKFALVNAEGDMTFWSNNGTSAGGREPTASLPVQVVDGGYEILLGDTNQPNMLTLSPTVFTNANIHVRVWFAPASQGPFQHLQPDQAMASVAYAMMAANVPDGSITSDKLADRAVTRSKLAPASVTSGHISPGSIGAAALAPNAAAANLQASGGLVLSEQSNATNLIAGGFRKIGSVTSDSESWETFSAFGPAARMDAVGVWTGSEFILWGGYGPTGAADRAGVRYRISTGTWLPISNTAAPMVQPGQRAVWTGSEMIVIGSNPDGSAIYSPFLDQWRRLSRTNAPIGDLNSKSVIWTGQGLIVWGGTSGRRYDIARDVWSTMANPVPGQSQRTFHSAVWTGSEIIVWGGLVNGTRANTGARYNPTTGQWRPMSATNTVAARSGHSAVWTGTEMIVWGGEAQQGAYGLNTGGRYNPVSDTWSTVTTTNAPALRKNHIAYWTGTEMLIWNGTGTNRSSTSMFVPLTTGGRYDPRNNTWKAIDSIAAPTDRSTQTRFRFVHAWTGNELLVWGGGQLNQLGRVFADGAIYRPSQDLWIAIGGPPAGRIGHTAVWTGSELIVWGGYGPSDRIVASSLLNSGGRFNPSTGRWKPLAMANAPTARRFHRAVWTGREMIVWGGEGAAANNFSLVPLNTGGAYDPKTDTWSRLESNGAPAGRVGHTATWSGREMIVWGGRTNSAALNPSVLADGARYHPETDSWSSISSRNSPRARHLHSAVWAGDRLIIWAGESPIGLKLTLLNNGATYDPFLNSWQPISTNGAPTPRKLHAAVWTGSDMIVWGGIASLDRFGARYNLTLDRWEPINRSGPADSGGTTMEQPAIWTGKEMYVCTQLLSDLFKYDPYADTWTMAPRTGAPIARNGFTVTWTGDALLGFGGIGSNQQPTNSVYRYSTTRPLYLYQKTQPTPVAASIYF